MSKKNLSDNPDEFISNSQLKRDAQALTDLGTKLLELSLDQLGKFNLPTNLMEALKVAKNIKKHGALKRQKLYIGKILRSVDAKPIEAQFEMLLSPHKEDVKQFHDVEKWRDAIIEDPNKIKEFLALYPTAQRQSLSKIQRDTINVNPQISSRAKRKLFLYIKDFVFIQTKGAEPILEPETKIESEVSPDNQDDFL